MENLPSAALQDNFGKLAPAVVRTVLNQGLAIPFIYYPLFFLSLAVVNNEKPLVRAVLRRARTTWRVALWANWRFWIPVQLVQFSVIATKYRVYFCLAAGVVWNAILSSIEAQQSQTSQNAASSS